jgi:hypothetical protein
VNAQNPQTAQPLVFAGLKYQPWEEKVCSHLADVVLMPVTLSLLLT